MFLYSQSDLKELKEQREIKRFLRITFCIQLVKIFQRDFFYIICYYSRYESFIQTSNNIMKLHINEFYNYIVILLFINY